MSKKTFTLIIVIVLAGIAGVYYWFFIRSTSPTIDTTTGTSENAGGSPIFGFGTKTGGTGAGGATSGKNQGTTNTGNTTNTPAVPVLRQLSTTPVGGMIASTTASTTIVRWVDRGVGRVYQAYSDSIAVEELSNTTIPRIYNTFWNKNGTSFILQSLAEDSDAVTTFYTTLYPVSTSTSATSTPDSTTPYALRGSALPSDTVAVAVSPKGDRVFTLENKAEGSVNGANFVDNNTIGSISQFNGSKKTQIFSTPLSALNIEWPEENTIALTTKGSSVAAGYLYFVDQKTGIFNKVIGNISGLTTLTSKDATKVMYSTTVGNSIKSFLYNIKTGANTNMLFNTMPEKCVWSTLQKNILYCAVPSQIPSGNYPEDWYQGNISFSDSIWEVDTSTGDAHLVADLLKTANTVIDATTLVLDPKENFLYFVNKKNLTLWSLELNG